MLGDPSQSAFAEKPPGFTFGALSFCFVSATPYSRSTPIIEHRPFSYSAGVCVQVSDSSAGTRPNLVLGSPMTANEWDVALQSG